MARGKRSRVRRHKKMPVDKKELRQFVRSEALRLAETKTVGRITENVQLFHNISDYRPGLLNVVQGTSDPTDYTNNSARVGDEVYFKSIQLKFWLSNKLDRPNVMWRLLLVSFPPDMTMSDLTCWHTNTNKMIDEVNTENIKILREKYIFSAQNYSPTHERSQIVTLNYKPKKPFKVIYNENNGVPRNINIGYIVVCYDAYGTLQTDNIGSYAVNNKFTFKDP